MDQTILNFGLCAMAIAGLAVIWRNWLTDHKSWKEIIKKRFGPISRSLLCGSCLTYWIALIVTLWARPLSSWEVLGNGYLYFIPNTFMQWMALAWLSVFLRFAYVALQELVHYQVHHMNETHKHEQEIK